MPVPLLVGALVLTAAATAASMSAASQQAKAASAAAKGNAQMRSQEQATQAQLAAREAQVAHNQVEQERQLRRVDADTEARQAERLYAQQRAMIGTSGVEFSGSPLLVAIETAQEAELQQATSQWQSEQRQLALSDQASLRQFEAGEFRRAGRATLAAGAWQAGQYQAAGRTQMLQAGLQGASQATGYGTTYLLTQRGYLGTGTSLLPRGS